MSSSNFPFHGIFSSLGQASEDSSPSAAFGSQPPSTPFQERSAPAKTSGQVAVDIYEQDGYYIIKAPIAGVRLSDIDLEISDNVITIRGMRHQGDNVAQDQYYLQECFWGEFSRSITMPFAIDPKKVKATFNKESILKILIPKEEKVKIVRISES